jgi:hypothetical protein
MTLLPYATKVVVVALNPILYITLRHIWVSVSVALRVGEVRATDVILEPIQRELSAVIVERWGCVREHSKESQNELLSLILRWQGGGWGLPLLILLVQQVKDTGGCFQQKQPFHQRLIPPIHRMRPAVELLLLDVVVEFARSLTHNIAGEVWFHLVLLT